MASPFTSVRKEALKATFKDIFDNRLVNNKVTRKIARGAYNLIDYSGYIAKDSEGDKTLGAALTAGFSLIEQIPYNMILDNLIHFPKSPQNAETGPAYYIPMALTMGLRTLHYLYVTNKIKLEKEL
jgi:hypothetical protein